MSGEAGTGNGERGEEKWGEFAGVAEAVRNGEGDAATEGTTKRRRRRERRA